MSPAVEHECFCVKDGKVGIWQKKFPLKFFLLKIFFRLSILSRLVFQRAKFLRIRLMTIPFVFVVAATVVVVVVVVNVC